MTACRYTKCGAGEQLIIESVDDLTGLLEVDEALWVATAAPIDSFRMDPVFMDQLDIHNDKRITAGEVKTAIRWTLQHLKIPEGINQRDTILSLDRIQADAPDSRSILQALSKMAKRTAGVSGTVSLQQIRDLKTAIENQPVSGSGVILPDAGQDEEIRQFLVDIVAVTGGTPHPVGAQGVDEKTLSTFLEQARDDLAWDQEGMVPSGAGATAIKPFGSNTADAYGIFVGLRDKFDQYFTLCDAVALDSKLMERFWPIDPETVIEDPVDPNEIHALLEKASLAEPDASGTFTFNQHANPLFKKQLQAFRQQILDESESMTLDVWLAVKQRFLPYEQWLAKKPVSLIADIEDEKLERYLEEKYAAAVVELIKDSQASSIELNHLCLAEKLALYQGLLLSFVNNFVSFPDLYAPEKRALFEEGTLIMDGRHFNMAVRVFNRKEHSGITQNGYMFVMYLELECGEKQPRYEIAVPVAAGTRGSLTVGKRGIFLHVDGSEWNAKVVQIVEKPISLTQAALTPFMNLAKALTGKFESLSATATKQLEKQGGDAITSVQTKSAKNENAPKSSVLGGNLAAAGVAVAALGSSFAFTLKMLASIKLWQIVASVGGCLLAVLIPSFILAVIKLRKRDIKTILEGSGWAINVPMRLHHSMKEYITQKPSS